MQNRIEEIEKMFFSQTNYLREVSFATIIFETSEKDSISISYRALLDQDKINTDRLKNNLRLYFSLNRLEKDLGKKVDQTLDYFFYKIDTPSNKVEQREYFLKYYSKFHEISKSIW